MHRPDVAAPLAGRVVAFLVDGVLVFNALVWTTWVVAAHAGQEPPGLVVLGLGVGVAGVALQELVGTALWGQTLGRRLVRIRVVRSDTYDVPGWTRATIRTFGLLPLSWMPHGNYAELAGQSYVFRRTWQGLHDLMAGTMVVDDDEWRSWATQPNK